METAPEPIPTGSVHPLRWFGIDLVCVAVFTLVGLLAHGSPLSGYLSTLWPFLVGLVVAWMAPGVRALPLIIWPSGVIVWAVTVVVGLALRWATGAGISGAFPWVAAGVLAVLLLGWRVVPEVIERRRERRARYL
ncbi:DUF3054 domain-containing protein [Georgenia sp. TF02-10]|uniref:DUF3054 domain-containing protein n=1 Tax=Georgenia sp. TF02-10 TaxID=2917725 RepID=UPI001FA76333|nr:DUF3054 domain-containing protein [Georgenia sp. TF02-10]UNX54127.1 DUF3054 domain-containing protein [Georgenia sp. TF02-10]